MILRNKPLKTIALFAIVSLAFVGCKDKNFQERTYTANVPIYLEHAEFRGAVASGEVESIDQAGKIYFKDHFLYINNRESGVHIIDNRDPANPVNAGYIKIPGNREIAINGNTMFADSYIDLVAIDISNPYDAKEVGRAENVFPQSLPSHDPKYRVQQPDPEKGVVIGWELETITEVVENGHVSDGFVDLSWDDNGFQRQPDDRFDNQMRFGVDGGTGRSAVTGGKSGSMAGFVLASNYLYVLNGNNIDVFDASSDQPVLTNTVETNRQVETLYPFGEDLFVGTTNGMLIYSLASPSAPQYVSVFEHAESCDPVIVEGGYAYVTLRSGRFCGGWSNQLDVIDVSDIGSPKLVSTQWMTSPYGLAIDESTLFVCEGPNGLKVFNAGDPEKLEEVGTYSGQDALDVITYNGVLMMIGQDGLYQYDFSDPANLSLLSSIKTN